MRDNDVNLRVSTFDGLVPDRDALLPKARKDPFDPFVQISALSEEEYAARQRYSSGPWRPITLTSPFLAAVVVVTLGLIVLVCLLLSWSNAHQGVLFAPDINDLPFWKSFLYLYLPTVISVVYSFVWTWIDLDVKRLEPFFQLSRPGGTTSEDSILLHYPFDFLALVPMKAFGRRHWSVFATSMIMVLIFWGLTPTQSGLFAVRTVTISETLPMMVPSGYMPISVQGNASAIYAQSAYNIAWLNESLPPFMTKDSMLGPFELEGGEEALGDNKSYRGSTTLYSVDLECEHAPLRNDTGTPHYSSTSGCYVQAPLYRTMGNGDTTKTFEAMYVGHEDGDGVTDYYLDDTCKDTFLVRWSNSTAAAIKNSADIDHPNPDPFLAVQTNATALFCTTHYYHREVVATISLPSKHVVQAAPESLKQPLPGYLFNTTAFEFELTSARQDGARADYPEANWPSSTLQVVDTPLDLSYVPQMAMFAIGAYQRPMADYMEPETLQEAFQAAYRLLFARRLSDVLHRELVRDPTATGSMTYTTQAVVVVPGFAYAVLTLLCLVSCLALWVLIISLRRSNMLRHDPSTILGLMRLAQGSSEMTARMATLGSCDMEELHQELRGAQLALTQEKEGGANGARLTLRRTTDSAEFAPRREVHYLGEGIRPTELHAAVGCLFVAVQVAALISFVYLAIRSKRDNGLPLPSESTFVRQLVENYIPIAAATFIEPFWLVLNRLLCMLQPWEELRAGNAKSSRSVALNYHSLPPQFAFWKAIRAWHPQLAFTCFMAILANGLSVALGGLMYEDITTVARPATFLQQHSANLHQLDGTGPPFNAPDLGYSLQDGTTLDQFYRDMSNLTAHTPLPPWTDNSYAYVPVSRPQGNASLSFSVHTEAIGAELQCQSLLSPSYELSWGSDSSANITVKVPRADGTLVHCTAMSDMPEGASGMIGLKNEYPGRRAVELAVQLTSAEDEDSRLLCRRNLVAGWIRAHLVPAQPTSQDTVDLPAMDVEDYNATMITCTPRIVRGNATVVVDSTGQVLRRVNDSVVEDSGEAAIALGAQANMFLIDNGGNFHVDALPSDFTNYLLEHTVNSSSFIDASAPVPKPKDVMPPFTDLYRKLFAILVSTNAKLIFQGGSGVPAEVSGSILAPETRIFVSEPAFIVSTTILVLYIVTSLWIYARRPWRILPRLPTTIASTIACFAASNALRDMDLHRDDETEPWRLWRWGYGVFVGIDGKAHVGIEREPLLMIVGKHGVGGTFDDSDSPSRTPSRH